MAEPSCSRSTTEALYRAVRHVLDRAQTDPDLGYQAGPGTEAFRLLVAAEAQHLGVDADELAVERGRDLQPAYRRRRARVLELQEQNDWLEQFTPACGECYGRLTREEHEENSTTCRRCRRGDTDV